MNNVVQLSTAKLKAPTIENRKVPPPRRVPNLERRSREYLTPQEVEKLMTAAVRTGRYGHRDATLILIAYRHALRVSELIALQWQQVDMKQGLLHVNRLKGSLPSMHPLRGPELRALRRIQRESDGNAYVFTTERGGPMTADNVRKIIARAGKLAELPFAAHPHMLRHACGYKLANDGCDTRSISAYMGHRNLQNSARYTEMAPDRFKNFWRD